MTGPGSYAAAGPPPRDPGAQPERTALAWRRTTLTCGIVVLLALRQLLTGDGGAVSRVAAGVAVAGWLLLVGVAHGRMRVLTAAVPPPARRGAVAAAGGCVLLLAAAGAAMLLPGRG